MSSYFYFIIDTYSHTETDLSHKCSFENQKVPKVLGYGRPNTIGHTYVLTLEGWEGVKKST